jgi:hypothetical protein
MLDGVIRVTMPVTFPVAAGSGDLRPEITVRYQACSEESCLPSPTARLRLLVHGVLVSGSGGWLAVRRSPR